MFRLAYVENPVYQPPGTEDGTGMITDPSQLLANLTLVQTYIPSVLPDRTEPVVVADAGVRVLRRASAARDAALRDAQAHRRCVRSPSPSSARWPWSCSPSSVALFVPLVNAATGVIDPNLLDWGANWAAVFTRSLLTNADNFAVGMLAAVVIVAMRTGRGQEPG